MNIRCRWLLCLVTSLLLISWSFSFRSHHGAKDGFWKTSKSCTAGKMQFPMTSQLFYAAQSYYYVHPQIQGVISSGLTKVAGVKPLILLSQLGPAINANTLSKAIQKFKDEDDVFSQDFLNDTIVIQTPLNVAFNVESLEHLETEFGGWNITSILHLAISNDGSLLPEGPYFLHGGNLHQAWRLYPDDLDCFMSTVIPDVANKTKYTALKTLDVEGIWKSVGVPSRMYSTPSQEKPLAGKRISIKENFRLAGVKTTMSNRAFTELYGPDEETSTFVQQLIDMGAVIVGKTKLSAFASSEEPTDQWIDFHAPFNPRGDGFQSPAGSTGGGAAAVAGYPWLDYSLGTDTTGSIRYPAGSNGVYALRYTSDTLPLDGVFRSCRAMDAVGLLGRDLQSFHSFVQLTVRNDSGNIKQFPKKILYPTDFLPYEESAQQSVLDNFLIILEEYLGVRKTDFSIAERWTHCPPDEAEGKGIEEYIEKTGFYPFYYDGYHEFDQFRDEYMQKFNRKAYVGPYMQWKWEKGFSVTLEQKNKSLKEMEVYRKWFSQNVLKENKDTASDAILIMPVSCYAPEYRDTPHKPPGIIPAFSEGYTASLIGLPQLVLPVGQIPYESRVSGRTEHHPVTVSFVGAKGSELMLINLAKAVLEKAAWPTEVLTGSNAFKVIGESGT